MKCKLKGEMSKYGGREGGREEDREEGEEGWMYHRLVAAACQ